MNPMSLTRETLEEPPSARGVVQTTRQLRDERMFSTKARGQHFAETTDF